MKMQQYQLEVNRTRNTDVDELANYTLGLVCECGEMGDIIKKHLYHSHELDKEKVKNELGDIMWYMNNLCNVLGFDIEEVAQMNIDKLRKRYPLGFSSEDSKKRVDVK